MPILTTFGGASIRAYGFSSALPPAMLPANTILFWSTTNTSSPPSGWSNYTTANDKFIRGSFTSGQIGTTAAANTSATATITVTTGAGGDHIGPSLSMFGNTSSNPSLAYLHYNATAPTHVHTSMTATLSGVIPDGITLPVIKTSSNTTTIPANTVIFRKTIPSSGNYAAYDTQIPTGRNHGFYKGGTSRAYANASGSATGTLSSAGTHDHLNTVTRYGVPGTGIGAGTSYAPGYVGAGSHTHTVDSPVKAVLKSKHLNAWISSVPETVEYGTIIMFVGDTTKLPAGWRLCNGTLGTPNMTDYFLGHYVSAAHGDVIADTPYVTADPNPVRNGASSTSTANPHSHFTLASVPAFPGHLYNGQHHTGDNIHGHPVTVPSGTFPAVGMAPDHLLVAFAQYKGI